MDFEKEIFKGKSFSSLLEDIYKNSKSKEKQIKDLILQLKDMIQEPGDAVMMVPLLQGYMEVAVKNDEALIKMAAIVQKAMSLNKTAESDGELLSERDKELLFAEIKAALETCFIPFIRIRTIWHFFFLPLNLFTHIISRPLDDTESMFLLESFFLKKK